MYQAGVPEKYIKKITGHKSDAVHTYEHTSESMKCKVSATKSKGTIDLTKSPKKTSETTVKKMKEGEHPVLQCMQSSGINKIVQNVPKEQVKSVKLHVEIECYEKC